MGAYILKKAGYLENSSRGVWALTDKAKQVSEIDSREIVNFVRTLDRKASQATTDLGKPELSIEDSPEEVLAWREKLHHVLIEEMSPDAFERLTQRLLRESGFIHVEVTGRTGDGGIDGKGIARINGLMSFHIAFQCKNIKVQLEHQRYGISEVQLWVEQIEECLLQLEISQRQLL